MPVSSIKTDFFSFAPRAISNRSHEAGADDVRRLNRFSALSSRAVRCIAALFFCAAFQSTAYAHGLKVVELFTSQSCYSCPAADDLVAELADNDDSILNLEFHVDYWNQLQYRNAGNWVDPYSTAGFTDRQRIYNANGLRGRNGVYTPQAVVNGVFGAIGSSRNTLLEELEKPVYPVVDVSVVRAGDNILDIEIEAEPTLKGQVFLVEFIKKTSTVITAGENHNKVMDNYNVVTSFRPIASLGTTDSTPPKPVRALKIAQFSEPDHGCAIVVQSPRQGPILGAARCP